MQIGMLDHLQKWIFDFMKTDERLDKFNGICLSVLAYHELTPNNKSYEEVSQWNECNGAYASIWLRTDIDGNWVNKVANVDSSDRI
jgi:hypothetical protein